MVEISFFSFQPSSSLIFEKRSSVFGYKSESWRPCLKRIFESKACRLLLLFDLILIAEGLVPPSLQCIASLTVSVFF